MNKLHSSGVGWGGGEQGKKQIMSIKSESGKCAAENKTAHVTEVVWGGCFRLGARNSDFEKLECPDVTDEKEAAW